MCISGTTMMMWLQSCPTCCSQPVFPACVVAAFKGWPQDPGGHVGHLHQTRQTLAHLLFLLTPQRLPCLPLTFSHWPPLKISDPPLSKMSSVGRTLVGGLLLSPPSSSFPLVCSSQTRFLLLFFFFSFRSFVQLR